MFVGATTEVGGVSYPACADGVNMIFLGDTGPAPFQESHMTIAQPVPQGSMGLTSTLAAQERHGRRRNMAGGFGINRLVRR